LFWQNIIYWSIGYSLTFGDGNEFIGSLENIFLKNITQDSSLSENIPDYAIFSILSPFFVASTLICYLISKNRNYSIIASTLAIIPIIYWIWGGGWLYEKEVADFAGGLAIIFPAVILGIIGMKEKQENNEEETDTGTQKLKQLLAMFLIYIGILGFNSSSALAANGNAASIFVYTNNSIIGSFIGMKIFKLLKNKKTELQDLSDSLLTGLAASAAPSGYASPISGFLLSATLSALNNYLVNRKDIDKKYKLPILFGIPSAISVLMLGLLGSTKLGGTGEGNEIIISQTKIQSLGLISVAAFSSIIGLTVKTIQDKIKN
jgi:ammonium transporter, Amt family